MAGGLRVLDDLAVGDHALVRARLAVLRDHRTPMVEFRRVVRELGRLLAVEATRSMPTRAIDVATPYETTRGEELHPPPTVVPILRAGLGLADGVLDVVPEAPVGHIGIYRDERSLEPVPYYAKFPPGIASSHVLLVDPMLATGGTACHAITLLKQRGCSAIMLLCVVASPQGAGLVKARHPEVEIVAAALDRGLSPEGRILPGLGDAGDRLYGTLDA